MARMSHWLAAPFIGLALVGCVSQEKYNAMKLDRDQLANRLGQVESELQSSQAQSDAYKAQLQAILNSGGNKDAMVANLTQQLGTLQGQYDALQKQYADALNQVGSVVALPKPVTDALTQFAMENPDLVDFDSARGIVKFKSDITFKSGSSELTPRAAEAISRFASILDSPAAVGYELQVAGHTDNQRVMHQATIQAGHKDNWYLSAHRAISVSDALQKSGVAPQRLAVVGYADQHPIADNGTDTGRAANRRVEVLILPTTVRSPAVARTRTNAPPQRRAAQRKPEFNKDSTVGTFNK
jgi:chemotaxis protein MotB